MIRCILHFSRQFGMIHLARTTQMAEWFDSSCEECGATIHVCVDWDHPPRFCKSCKAEHDAKFYDKACEECGATIRVCVEWDHPPRFCKSCKQTNAGPIKNSESMAP